MTRERRLFRLGSRQRLLAVLLSGALLSGCAINPATGLPIMTLVSTEQEKELGKEAAGQVDQTMGLVEDRKLNDYIAAIGARLAKESPRTDVPYEFHVVEMVEPNAFALPGGYIYVSRGILPILNSEEELAGIIGHEIGHVAARHSVRRVSLAAPFAIVGAIVGGVTGIVSPRLGNALGAIPMLAGGLVIQPYSRGQEQDADTIGVRLAAAAGYDPTGLPSALSQLEREVELMLGGPQRSSFFDSHPNTPGRVKDTTEQAKKTTWTPRPPIAATRAEFFAKLDGLVVGENPAEGLVEKDNLFVHPDFGLALQFPAGWKTNNTHQGVQSQEKGGPGLAGLTLAGEGTDPLDGVRKLEKDSGETLVDKVETFKIGEIPAARLIAEVRTREGNMTLDLTWVAYRGLLFQVIGLAPVRQYAQYAPTFTATVKSFRPLTASERAGIHVTKLRIVTAQEGETISGLASRTGTTWKLAQIAVANDLPKDAPLKAGQIMKVAIKEPYRGAGQ